VDLGHHVDQRLAGRAPLRRGEDRLGGAGVAQDVALDEAHDVEGGAVHAHVVAEAEGGGDGHRGGAEGGDDAVLPAHVVRGGQHLAERRAAEHEGAPGGVGHLVRQVRVATGDEVVGDGAHEVGDVRLEPRRDLRLVDPLDGLGHVSPTRSRTGRPAGGHSSGDRYRGRMADVTDATFERDVLVRSRDVPSSSTCGPRGAARASS
jgi:hypothetical protein